ncbi:MAG: sodium:calcium antiporter [Candidatus Bathyarchaeia archaeon]|nr:sodium:calcium antiporter [Candidatus Bathyarchaeota archaeon]
MFEQLGLLGNVLILLISLYVLDKACDIAIDNAVKVSEITGLGKTTIGYALIALITTLPELSVSILIAMGVGDIGIAIGNVLGSNIVNVCFILGLIFLITSLRSPQLYITVKEEVRTLHFGLFITSLIPVVLIYIGYASRVVGIILVSIFVYEIYNISKRRRVEEVGGAERVSNNLKRYLALTILGLTAVITSAYLIVDTASYIAEYIGIPTTVIGATIIAFGTSLPEFTIGLKSSLKGYLELVIGNIVGSCFTNITLILGVALIGREFVVNMASYTSMATFTIMVCLILWYLLSNRRIGWREGILLFSLYILFLIEIFGGYRVV